MCNRLIFVLFAGLLACGCAGIHANTRVISSQQFSRALQGERIYMHLHNERHKQVAYLYVDADSVWYQQHQDNLFLLSIRRHEVVKIEVTRPRKPKRAHANVIAGGVIGAGLGVALYVNTRSDFSDDCDSCVTQALAGQGSLLSIPIGSVLGFIAGALVNIPRPRDTYVIDVDADGAVQFIKTEH